MKFGRGLAALAALASSVAANKAGVDQTHNQKCTGMYAKEAWGGNVNPFISFNLKEFSEDPVNLAVVVFEFQDLHNIGKELISGEKTYICNSESIESSLCTKEQEGTFIIGDTKTNKSEILTYHVAQKGLAEQKYHVKNTGYYCLTTYRLDSKATYKGEINFRNSFGNIAAAEFPKLALYGILAVAYAVTFAYYGFNFWKHKHEVLPLQKYFLFYFLFLTAETILVWSLFDMENRSSSINAGVKVYMVFISLLNAFKFTFSFFLLLVIALGYGVVYPKLDKKLMLKCQLFSVLHFALAAFYIISNYLSSAEKPSDVAAVSAIPITVVTAIFYVFVLSSLSKTTALLGAQRQIIKLKMYRRLFRIIFVSLLVLILGIIVSSFIYLGMSTTDLIEQHWKSRFFFLDFWPSLVYFVIFNLIAFIWRPTDSSYMLAASSQLPTDPENAADFELDDLQSLNEEGNGNEYNHLDNDSLDLESDDEHDQRTTNQTTDTTTGSSSNKKSFSFDDERTVFDSDKLDKSK